MVTGVNSYERNNILKQMKSLQFKLKVLYLYKAISIKQKEYPIIYATEQPMYSNNNFGIS